MIIFEKGAGQWTVEQDGRLNFRQDQLFNLQRLSLVILGQSRQRLRYRTLEELEQLLQYAEDSDDQSVRRQLQAVRSVLPYRITRNHMAANG
ncbi:hypothetical protein QQM79_06555 [Marinobacteraceae bacterium S3BR75-40.1]